MIDRDRLWNDHMAMAEVGPTPGGGSCRLALTDEDKAGRDLFRSWCEAAGLGVRIDACGNIFARRPGTDADAAPVMTGSHLDTQPLGGRFDGIYGVLAGLEVMRALDDAGIRTRRPLEVVVWTDEEGVRFGGGCMASGVFAGVHPPERFLGGATPDGVTVAEELERIGYAGPEPCGGRPVHAFFEAHIEQGPVLEAEGRTVGVVLAGQGQRLFEVEVTGEEGHAGTLPMDRRKDAFVGAARMAVALNDLAFRHRPVPVITTGRVFVKPNSRNTIPGGTRFSSDCRHPEEATLEALEADMRTAMEGIAADAGLGLDIRRVSRREPVVMDPGCVATIREAAERLAIPHMDIYSGAGHDAFNLLKIAPTGMIFVPCEKGISHNETENAKPDDLAAGAAVLLEAMVAYGERV